MECQHARFETCWHEPPPLDPANVARWQSYCSEIEERIRQVRAEEAGEPWRAFGTDLEDFAEPRALPVGLIQPYRGTLLRDANGRYRRAS